MMQSKLQQATRVCKNHSQVTLNAHCSTTEQKSTATNTSIPDVVTLQLKHGDDK
jgi:hypothetical protein